MLLMIDNYDSFTYNVVQYLGELGAEVKVVRNDELTVAQIEALKPERIVVSPGPCTPTEAGISIERSSISPASCRFSAYAWGISPSARPLAARWCVPGK